MVVRVLALLAVCTAWCADRLRPLHRAERGEGVISVAIAVLIMAIIGAGLWTVFDTSIEGAETRICQDVARIGEGDDSPDAGGAAAPAAGC